MCVHFVQLKLETIHLYYSREPLSYPFGTQQVRAATLPAGAVGDACELRCSSTLNNFSVPAVLSKNRPEN